MPKRIKLNRRSVGTQSSNQVIQDEQDENAEGTSRRFLEIGTRVSGLCKKFAYRNLLQRSITFDNQCITNERSTATQTDSENKSLLDDGPSFQKERSVEVAIPLRPISSEISLSPSLLSEEMLPIFKDSKGSRDHREDVPGTSEMLTSQNHLNSVERHLTSVEGSLTLACNSGEDTSSISRLSNVVCLHENQGCRRQSNEAVLLVEDYQSYDFLNMTRRQANSNVLFKNKLEKLCLKKKKYRDEIRRPISVISDTSALNSSVCRICHEGDEIEALIHPCLCKGSIGNIHAKCLKLWLEQSNTSRCEICGYPYMIRQTRRYSRFVSFGVFLRTVVDRRTVFYDIISFLAVTPLCIVGIAMCLRASFLSATSTSASPNFQIGNITKIGMIMLSTTIFIAYGIWLYTLLSFHYKSWKRWYKTCYDVEVIPVNVTSQERLEALQRMAEESRRRSCRMERGGSLGTALPSSHSNPYQTLFPTIIPVTERVNHNET